VRAGGPDWAEIRGGGGGSVMGNSLKNFS